MDKISPDFLLNLMVIIATAGATYGAIKGDLKVMHERIKNTNRRIDDLQHRRSTDFNESGYND